jgi:galactose oxidase-like protein/Kelch motif protein
MKLPSARLFATGLVASIAVTALAGTGGFNTTGSMNVARDSHAATRLPNGEVLVTGGFNNTDGYLASAELYNPVTGKWRFTGSMTVPREGHEAVLLQNGQVLVAGGLNASTFQASLASAELYNPATGTWTPTGNMTTGRESFALTVLANGEVLAAGGFSNGSLSNAELYNPATGQWSSTGSIVGNNIVNDNGAVLLQTGEVFAASTNLYNPSTATWSTTSSPPVGGFIPIALLPNGDVWTAGNLSGDSLYNPSTNQWTTFAPPPCTTLHQGCEAAAATLTSGKVLVAGGVTRVNAQPYPLDETNGLAALFDPSTLTWATTGSMHTSRVGETMTVLSNGQVLVAGGDTFEKHLGRLVPIASAELYTP